MTIQYASDLHLELSENADYLKEHPLEAKGDILVLAGDTAYLGDHLEDAGWFFDWCSKNFKQTFLLPGNHEYYGGFPLEDTLSDFELKVRDNVTYLNNRSVMIDDTELFFTTLWTSVPGTEEDWIGRVMNDCRMIRHENRAFTTQDWNRVHSCCKRWLSSAIEGSKAAQKVVVSHHCPLGNQELVSFVGRLNKSAYIVPMPEILCNHSICAWIHGHIHQQREEKSEGCMVISNPLGYVSDHENEGFGLDYAVNV